MEEQRRDSCISKMKLHDQKLAMSPKLFLPLIILLSTLLTPFSYAESALDSLIDSVAEEESTEKSITNTNELKGIDISSLSAEELLPAIEGFELPKDRALKVAVIPVKTGIGGPSFYLLRRSTKEAIKEGADVLIIDMDTPGGSLYHALEMMSVLNEFPGLTITYINDEAISAGAIISSVTDYIYMSKTGIIGAAAAVTGSGEEIPETMKAKLYSYMDARIESYSQGKQFRSKVLKAMMDVDYEFILEGTLISPKEKLLSLTASKAMVKFGDPAETLLAAGIADSIDEIIATALGAEDFELLEYESSWAEEFAVFLGYITPLLMGVGLVMLIVEMKTPMFGLLGITGIILMLIAFFGQHVAGLAGYEAIIFLVIGVLLLALEIFVIPGTSIAGFLGALSIMFGIVWSFADVWPKPAKPGEEGEGLGWTVSFDSIETGLVNLAITTVVVFVILGIIWKYLPKTPLFSRIVMEGQSAGPSTISMGGGTVTQEGSLPDVGSVGVVVMDLHPTGEIEIDGKRYEATVQIGTLPRGEDVIVTGYKSFALLVDKQEGEA